MKDKSKHPCFNGEVRRRMGRIHLPVAPKCNMQCNFCNRKYDCVNEGRPGVTSAVLTPSLALEYLADSLSRRAEITVVGLAGPGDPFANPDETMQTLRSVRREYPGMLLCVATNGLAIEPYIEELAELEVGHVTLTVNAVDPKVGAKIYSWIRDGKRLLRGESAAGLLWRRQESAIRKLKSHGITVKINSIIIPGVNDRHIPEVVKAVAQLGADVMNCMPMAPVQESVFQDLAAPDARMTESIRSSCGKYLAQMNHCARCRADAVGLISESATEPFNSLKQWIEGRREKAERVRPYVAVASHEGALVNQHLGEAASLMIYQRSPNPGDGFVLKELRSTPPRGGGDGRWVALATELRDCRALLAASIGLKPREILGERGIRIVEMEGLIQEGLKAVFGGHEVPAAMNLRVTGRSQSVSCRGAGTGCG